MIKGICGLVHRNPDRPVSDATALSGQDASSRGCLTGHGVRFGAFGAGVWAEREGDTLVAADVDISNLDEITASVADGSRSPGRVLSHLCRQDAAGFPNRLRGAFAVALWEPAARRLVLAADRFGFRRIFYAVNESGIAFSSRLRDVFDLPGLPRDIDPDSVYAYLNFGTIPAPQTIYRNVRRLLPGHVLQWRDGSWSVERYWDVRYREVARSGQAAAAALVHHTQEAVRQALVDVNPKHVGSFLSGGTDSSTVVGLMTRLTGEQVHAFSIGFREPRYDELPYAELAARHFGAAHYSHIVTADEAFGCLPELVAGYDEPFGNNSAIPTYLCARFASQTGMQVLLAGDGGDEIFGGNERYRREHVLSRYSLIPSPVRRHLIEPLLRWCPPGGLSLLGKAQRYVQRASLPNPDRFYSSEFFVGHRRGHLLTRDFLAAITPTGPWDIARRHYLAAPASSELNRLLYVDLKITLGDNDLLKVNRAAELAGIAVRFPMLDHPLVEFMATLPARDKVRGAEKRYLFKRAFASLLPREVLAKSKHGFGLPISEWLKTHAPFHELTRDTLLSTRARGRGYFAAGAVEQLFRLHAEDSTPYYGDVLWTLLMLELWHRQHEVVV
jgi:asparagine synthase (glutamine-hydrolysing)